MKRTVYIISLAIAFSLKARAQQINMYDLEQKIFNSQVELAKKGKPFALFGSDLVFGDDNKAGRILVIQTGINAPLDELELPLGLRATTNFMVGINACAHLYKWWPPNDSYGYGGRNYMAYTLNFKSAILVGGLYLNIAMHDAFEHLDWGISQGYVDKNPLIFRIRPFFSYKFDRFIKLDITTIIGNYFNTDAFVKLVNLSNFRFMPGLNYERTVVDSALSSSKISRISYKNVLAFPESNIYLRGSVGMFYNKGKLSDALQSAFQNPGAHFYYIAEASAKGLLLGGWYRKDYGPGFYVGIGQDDFESSKLFVKLKYNDGMIEPLYKNIKGVWSLSFSIFFNID